MVKTAYFRGINSAPRTCHHRQGFVVPVTISSILTSKNLARHARYPSVPRMPRGIDFTCPPADVGRSPDAPQTNGSFLPHSARFPRKLIRNTRRRLGQHIDKGPQVTPIFELRRWSSSPGRLNRRGPRRCRLGPVLLLPLHRRVATSPWIRGISISNGADAILKKAWTGEPAEEFSLEVRACLCRASPQPVEKPAIIGNEPQVVMIRAAWVADSLEDAARVYGPEVMDAYKYHWRFHAFDEFSSASSSSASRPHHHFPMRRRVQTLERSHRHRPTIPATPNAHAFWRLIPQ